MAGSQWTGWTLPTSSGAMSAHWSDDAARCREPDRVPGVAPPHDEYLLAGQSSSTSPGWSSAPQSCWTQGAVPYRAAERLVSNELWTWDASVGNCPPSRIGRILLRLKQAPFRIPIKNLHILTDWS
ncbi:hypothetical protein GCM10027168_43930 [Streptomyces capparidis]